MAGTMLEELLDRNRRHTDGLASDHFEGLEAGQDPPVVSVCCSDSRVSAEGMWAVDQPGFLFLSETIGNQVWDEVDGELVLDGDIAYPVTALETRTIAVVGHTGCGAVAAALQAVEEGTLPEAPGLAQKVRRLVPIVEGALQQPGIRAAEDRLDRLVEVNVHTQVGFLDGCQDVPDGTQVLGFVYDLHRVYGQVPGRAYLVNIDGERDPEQLKDLLPGHLRGHVASLLRDS